MMDNKRWAIRDLMDMLRRYHNTTDCDCPRVCGTCTALERGRRALRGASVEVLDVAEALCVACGKGCAEHDPDNREV